jgi:hypothetical protein
MTDDLDDPAGNGEEQNIAERLAWAEGVLRSPTTATDYPTLLEDIETRRMALQYMLLREGVGEHERHVIGVGIDSYRAMKADIYAQHAEEVRQAEWHVERAVADEMHATNLAQAKALTRATWALVMVTTALIGATFLAALIARG